MVHQTWLLMLWSDASDMSQWLGELGIGNTVFDATDGGGEEVAPTFAHTTVLTPAEKAQVDRSTGETSGQTGCELVDDNDSFHTTVGLRVRGVLEVHPATPVLTIYAIALASDLIRKQEERTRRCHEARVAESTAFPSTGNDRTVALGATSEAGSCQTPRKAVVTEQVAARGVQKLSAQPDDGGGGVGSGGLTLFCHVYSRPQLSSSEMILVLFFPIIIGLRSKRQSRITMISCRPRQ